MLLVNGQYIVENYYDKILSDDKNPIGNDILPKKRKVFPHKRKGRRKERDFGFI